MRKPKRKGHRKSPPRKRVEGDVDTFLASQEADRTADYANRGRAYKHLTDQQLTEKWVAAFRHLAEAPRDSRRRALESDLSAEFKLRDIKPPHDQVYAEIKRITSSLVSWIEAMKRNEPERFEQINEQIERDIDDLKARIRKSN
jgi:hypothetical protein